MTFVDAHTHITNKDLDILRIPSLQFVVASASTPSECEFLLQASKEFANLRYSFGIHPWNADTVTLDEMLPYLEKCDYIGEIGMDNVWCDVEMPLQQSIFLKQLDIAEKYQKPIILHTKGCEKQIAQIIQGYTMPILVHWYSDLNDLELYIKKGCYFTIGPDIANNPAVQNVVRSVDISRMLIETDGLSALEWVFNRPMEAQQIPLVLENTISEIAKILQMNTQEIRNIIFQNALDFFGFDK